MWIWNKMLASIISASILAWASKCSDGVEANSFNNEPKKVEEIVKNNLTSDVPDILKVQKEAKKEISICLKADDENSFTHTKALEQVSDPKNTILEYPVAQLFQKYGENPHPFRVSLVWKDFTALLWRNWIERLLSKTPQKLVSRPEEITSDTKYEVGDTLRFSLIDPLLKDDFPQYLSDQLQEEWFEEFSDADSLDITRKQHEKKYSFFNDKEKSDFIYDIVVKRVPSWKAALALYRNWELFMATYVSVGLNSRKTQTWQYKVLSKEPYKRSRKYDNAAMPEALNFFGGYYLHQWNVTWYPASHGCVRLPGVYADILYSSVKNPESVDVFVSKNLYK
jgi:hypothetical protein